MKLRYILTLIIFLPTIGLIFSFQNCQQTPNGDFQSIDSDFIPLVAAFLEKAKNYRYDPSLTTLKVTYMGDFNFAPNVMGYCRKEPLFKADGTWLGTAPTIQIKKSYWTLQPEYKQRDLLFHELGHCILNRSHTPKKSSGEVLSLYGTGLDVSSEERTMDISIMNPIVLSSILGQDEYQNIESRLEAELFTGALNEQTKMKATAPEEPPLNAAPLYEIFSQNESGECEPHMEETL